jgi:hypothetical protein
MNLSIAAIEWRVFVVVTLLLGGCSAGVQDSGHGNGHAHTAKFGGELVALGNHQFNLEIVHGEKDGDLVVYVLGPHAEKQILIKQKQLRVTLQVDSSEHEMLLEAFIEDSSKHAPDSAYVFSGTSDWLKGREGFRGILQEVEILGTSFKEVSFDLHEHRGHAH